MLPEISSCNLAEYFITVKAELKIVNSAGVKSGEMIQESESSGPKFRKSVKR